MIIKSMLMSAVEIRTEIDAWLDTIEKQDQSLLKAFHAMLGTYIKEQEDPLGYDADGKPLFVSKAKALFKAELEGVKRGEYMTIEDFEKEAKKW